MTAAALEATIGLGRRAVKRDIFDNALATFMPNVPLVVTRAGDAQPREFDGESEIKLSDLPRSAAIVGNAQR